MIIVKNFTIFSDNTSKMKEPKVESVPLPFDALVAVMHALKDDIIREERRQRVGVVDLVCKCDAKGQINGNSDIN